MAKARPHRGAATPSGTKFRTRWRHVLAIERLIRLGNAPNCRNLAQELEVCRRTILRDLDFMKYDLGAPIDYVPEKGGYIFTEPNWVMPSVRLSEGDLLAIMVADKALQAFAGTPWARQLRASFERIIAALPEPIVADGDDLLSRVSFDDGPAAITDPDTVERIVKAIHEGQSLRLTYLPLNKDRAVTYTIDPYVVRRSRGAWYLVARDHRNGHMPQFNLARVQGLKPTGQTFDFADSGFDAKAYFDATFGVFHSSGRHRVVIEFSGNAARLVRERKWHASQKLKDLPGGRLRMEVVASHLVDVLPWVLSWGAAAKVLEPVELRKQVATEARQLAGVYDQSP